MSVHRSICLHKSPSPHEGVSGVQWVPNADRSEERGSWSYNCILCFARDEILHPHWYRQEWPYFPGSLGWPFWPSGWPFRSWPCTWCAWWLWNLQWPQFQLANLGWLAVSGTWQVAQPPVLDPWMGLAPTHEESTRCWQGACMCLDAVGQLWLAGWFWAQQVFAPANSAFPLDEPLCPP